MFLSDTIEVPLSGLNVKHYERLGYKIPRQKSSNSNKMIVPRGTRITVNVEDLPRGSNVEVPCVCDFCGKTYKRKYMIIRKEKENGSKFDSCGDKDCFTKLIEITKIEKYGTTNTAVVCAAVGKKAGRSLKYSLEDFVNEFSKSGKIVQTNLLDTDRLTVSTRIPFVCKSHKDAGVQFTTLDCVKNAKCCCKYGRDERIGDFSRNATIEEANDICKQKGYTILTKNIKSVDDKIEYICNQHKDYGVQTTTLYGLRKYDKNCKLCHSVTPSGELHWNWKGGSTAKDLETRKSWQYIRWRKEVYRRDNYTCQRCNASGSGVVLNAHHILNFSEYEDLKFDVSNGITLCEKCHHVKYEGSFHSIYGVRNNNAEQLKEFLATEI